MLSHQRLGCGQLPAAILGMVLDHVEGPFELNVSQCERRDAARNEGTTQLSRDFVTVDCFELGAVDIPQLLGRISVPELPLLSDGADKRSAEL